MAWTFNRGAGAALSMVTALPGSPIDGQEIVYVDSLTAPTFQWRFRYNSGDVSAYKWECLGGTPKGAEVATSETTQSTSYAALTTAGPSVDVPLAGEYMVHQGASLTGTGDNGTGQTANMSYDIEGTGAVDADSITSIMVMASGGGGGAVSRIKKKTFIINDSLVSKYKRGQNGVGQNLNASNRFIYITPVRVG